MSAASSSAGYMTDDDIVQASILFIGRVGQPGGRKAYAFWSAGADLLRVCDLDGDGQCRYMSTSALARLTAGKVYEVCPPGTWPATMDDTI